MAELRMKIKITWLSPQRLGNDKLFGPALVYLSTTTEY